MSLMTILYLVLTSETEHLCYPFSLASLSIADETAHLILFDFPLVTELLLVRRFYVRQKHCHTEEINVCINIHIFY